MVKGRRPWRICHRAIPPFCFRISDKLVLLNGEIWNEKIEIKSGKLFLRIKNCECIVPKINTL